MWAFDSIRKLAIVELSQFALDPINKYLVAREYAVTEWLVPTLNEMAQRAKPMTVEDAERLGLECVLKVAEVRESLVPRVYGRGSAHLGVAQRGHLDLDFKDRIRHIFDL
jgi:hypothetical protein